MLIIPSVGEHKNHKIGEVCEVIQNITYLVAKIASTICYGHKSHSHLSNHAFFVTAKFSHAVGNGNY